MGVGGRKTEERNLKGRVGEGGTLYFVAPSFSPACHECGLFCLVSFPHAVFLQQNLDLLMNAPQLEPRADVSRSPERVFLSA